MLGHMVGLYLAERGHDVVGASRRGQRLFPSVKIDVADEASVSSVLRDGGFDVAVNCIAITCDHFAAPHDEVMNVNGRFPHLLADICADMPTKVLQISTDGVFSGDDAPYADSAVPDVIPLYGRSKAEGELHDEKNLTIRSCPFGPDINPDGVSLFNWFVHADPPVTGWTEALFTGVTTLALAQFIERVASEDLVGLVQFAPAQSISKARLLHLIDERFRVGRSADVQDVPGVAIDRSLLPSRSVPYATAPGYEQMLDELKGWVEDHPGLYQ